MIDYLDKVYIINLREDTKRYQSITQNLSTSIIYNKHERFNAVNGKYIDIRILNDNILTDAAKEDIMLKKQKIYGISLTYGSLGCALSHFLLYQKIAKSDKPSLILEDDIILKNDFDNQINILINRIHDIDYDICYIGYNKIPGFNIENIDTVISKPSGLITGLYSYIVTPTGAKKILDTVFPLNFQIDSGISRNQNKLNLICSSDLMVKVQTNFISKTQKSASCENHCQYESESDWNKLFKK